MLADDCGKERNAALSSASMLLPSTNHPTMLVCSLIQVYIVIHQSIKPPLYSDPDINNTYTILAGKKNALQKCTSYYVILKVFRYFPVWIRQSFQLFMLDVFTSSKLHDVIYFSSGEWIIYVFWLNEAFRREGDVYIIWLLFVIPKTQPSIHQLPSNHSTIQPIQLSNQPTNQPSNHPTI